MDVLIEIIIDVYGEIIFGLIPEEGISRRARRLIKLTAIMIFFGVVALTAVGTYYLVQERRAIGFLPIGIAIAILAAHIVLFVVTRKRKK